MRVLVNDANDLLIAAEATEVIIENEIGCKDNDECYVNCPCLHIITSSYDVYIPMSRNKARELVLEVYANNVLDLSMYGSRTYYDPDEADIAELIERIASNTMWT